MYLSQLELNIMTILNPDKVCYILYNFKIEGGRFHLANYLNL